MPKNNDQFIIDAIAKWIENRKNRKNNYSSSDTALETLNNVLNGNFGRTNYGNIENEEVGAVPGSASGLFSANDQINYQTMSAERAMQFSAEQAQINRDWQERMSNTAMQRQVADLKAAGLNPLLAYSSLGGASTPSGSSASGAYQSGANDDALISTMINTFERVISDTFGSAIKLVKTLK